MTDGNYPRLAQFVEQCKENHFTESVVVIIDTLAKSNGDVYRTFAEELLTFAHHMGWDPYELFLEFIVEYLREQAYFRRTGGYGHHDFDKIKKDVYDNAEVMHHSYLPGLFLGFAFVPTLYTKYRLFDDHFVSKLNSKSDGAEVGFGEGFYLWQILRRVPGIRVRGFDISEPAVRFSIRVLRTAGYPEERFDLRQGDVISGLPLEDGSLDWTMLAEVIEHLPEPIRGIEEAAKKLRRGGWLFLTTVIDTNHRDHICNFSDSGEVEDLITGCDFAIENALVYKMKDEFPGLTDISVGLGYVCRKR